MKINKMYVKFKNFAPKLDEDLIKIKFLIILAVIPEACNELTGPSPRHCPRATQLLLKKRRRGGESLATLCPI